MHPTFFSFSLIWIVDQVCYLACLLSRFFFSILYHCCFFILSFSIPDSYYTKSCVSSHCSCPLYTNRMNTSTNILRSDASYVAVSTYHIHHQSSPLVFQFGARPVCLMIRHMDRTRKQSEARGYRSDHKSHTPLTVSRKCSV